MRIEFVKVTPSGLSKQEYQILAAKGDNDGIAIDIVDRGWYAFLYAKDYHSFMITE